MIIYTYNPKLKNQKFAYDMDNNMWFNELTKRAILPADLIAPGETIATDDMKAENEQMKWDVVRCEDAEIDDEEKAVSDEDPEEEDEQDDKEEPATKDDEDNDDEDSDDEE